MHTTQVRLVSGWSGPSKVLGLRFAGDRATGTRFDRLDREIGPAFIRVDLEGKGHATLTAHRQQPAVNRVLQFFGDRLKS
jgi:hypothetical protein